MRVAVVCGDRWHPAEVIHQGLLPLMDDDIALDFFTDTSDWSRERMQQYDVFVLARDNGWVTDTVGQDLRDYVRQGGGLLICHSGTVGCRETHGLLALVGGVFLHHPHPCPVTLEYCGDFGRSPHDPKTISIHDEHYFVETTDDIDVFLRSTSENGTQPAGWTRREGDGRVCVLTPGHFADVWSDSVYQNTLRIALNWCAASEKTGGAT